MINTDELDIVNYCHQNCIPLMNIARLSKEKAFSMAYELAGKNVDTTAFYRFTDFKNYYPIRMNVDSHLYKSFVAAGGKPMVDHPLSFVLHGSEYLNKWFGYGNITRIPLKTIPFEYISFTYGDSMATFERTGNVTVITKNELLEDIDKFGGTIDEYLIESEKEFHYIEAQLWNDDYCTL